MKSSMKWVIGVVALLVVAGLLAVGGWVAYEQGWIFAPVVIVEVTAATEMGAPLAGVSVELVGEGRGITSPEGKLALPLTTIAPGSVIAVRATLERPGLRITPHEEKLVVHRWRRRDPASLRQALTLTLEVAVSTAEVMVEAGGAPAVGADVAIDGKPAGKTDATGIFKVDLTPGLSRTGKLAVKLAGYEPLQQDVAFEAGARVAATWSRRVPTPRCARSTRSWERWWAWRARR